MLNNIMYQPDYEILADLFGVMANPIRLKILDYLLHECCKRIENGCSVGEIFAELNIPQPYISKHLKILKEKGILEYERQNNKIFYRFSDENKLIMIIDFIRQFMPEDCSKEIK